MDFAQTLRLPDGSVSPIGVPAAPGVCVGSLDDGEESYGAYGVRSVEDPVPVTADTLFRVASISKLITATVLTRLGVGLDALVRDHIPGFRVADPAVGEQVTVRDLLTHRSGWAPDEAAYRPADELDAGALARAVADLATAPQIFPLRRFHGYSNAGFIVLARIVEVAAGVPFEDAARRLVFEPAGMERSTFFTDEAVTYPIALGHQGDPPRVVRPWGRSRARNGAGGLITSARDLIAFCRHLLAEPHGMWEPLADAAGPGAHVGVGWKIRDLPGEKRAVGHPGQTVGYTARLTILPDSGRAFVILANSEHAGPDLARITDETLGLPAWAEPGEYVQAPDVRDHLGVYTDGTEDVRVDGLGDGVVLSGDQAARVRFTGPDEGRDEGGMPVRFARADGEITWLLLGDSVLRRRPL
ncbi:serine hydrolase domain-containing protein [Actinoallomurus vinaceus]|uniref:Serine hydrolase domain-containing protein n=1 Tax=Actinoallomurus vinaceus TaxID=1080074 RepID=A0ABP8UNV2_9ACTN